LRLDLFLKYSRLVPRRPVAQKMCEAGAVSVNEAVAKSSRVIRAGDRISIRVPRRILTVRVLTVPTRAPSKAAAASLYELVEEQVIRSEESDLLPDESVRAGDGP
jgi:ribosomal 50S subunit-recycling heat shock protein